MVFLFYDTIKKVMLNDQAEPAKKPKSPKKYPQILLAWLSMPVLGVIYFTASSFVSFAIVGDTDSAVNVARFLIINSFVGLVSLLVTVLLVTKLKRSAYRLHTIIGLLIGVLLYSLIAAFAVILYVVSAYQVFGGSSSDDTYNTAVCSNPIDQYQKYSGAIVPIATDKGYGSGFYIDQSGRILTAYHVVQGARVVYANYATGDQRLKVVAVAPEYDLALLSSGSETSHFIPLSDQYDTGDDVLVYGYPGNTFSGGYASISKGIVSRILDIDSLRMSDETLPDNLEIIQTDAAINPGNSGGVLIGPCGAIGVVVALSDSGGLSSYIGVVSEQGIGYAVSTKTAREVFDLP